MTNVSNTKVKSFSQTSIYFKVHIFKKIQDWNLKSERIRKWILHFFTKQINSRSLSDHGASKEPLVFGSSDTILDFLKETHPWFMQFSLAAVIFTLHIGLF